MMIEAKGPARGFDFNLKKIVLLFVAVSFVVLSSYALVNKWLSATKTYCEYDELEGGQISISKRYFSIWEVYCAEGYAITHAIAPGQTSYLMLISDSAPTQRHQNGLPSGGIAIRSRAPLSVSQVDRGLRVAVEASDIVDIDKDIAGLGIDVRYENQKSLK